MGRPEMAEKHIKSGDPSLQPPPPSPARSGRVRRQRLDGKFYRQLRLDVLLLHGRRVNSSGGRNRLPRLKPDRSKNGSKRPSSGFSGVFGFSLGFLGLDPYLAPKTRLI